MGIEGWRPVEANSTGSQGSRRAVAPSDDDDDDDDVKHIDCNIHKCSSNCCLHGGEHVPVTVCNTEEDI